MEKLEQLRSIAEKQPSRITKTEKTFIEETSQELGVDFNPKAATCGNCYKDQAIILYNKLNAGNEKPKEGKYRLPVGKVINWGGSIIRAEDMTDSLAEILIAKGFGKLFE